MKMNFYLVYPINDAFHYLDGGFVVGKRESSVVIFVHFLEGDVDEVLDAFVRIFVRRLLHDAVLQKLNHFLARNVSRMEKGDKK